ncbi:MAG: preprotein translocase subunit SecG [Clostridiales bacterium]|nr:preprotein translocase subunit SecG [Clostridiales bacterium]
MEILNMLMASGSAGWTAWHDWIKIIFLVVMALCAIFIVLVVLFQPGNSSGIGALGGQTETFLGKNKSKTFEHKMKKLTVISSVIFAVLCIAFAIVSFLATK